VYSPGSGLTGVLDDVGLLVEVGDEVGFEALVGALVGLVVGEVAALVALVPSEVGATPEVTI